MKTYKATFRMKFGDLSGGSIEYFYYVEARCKLMARLLCFLNYSAEVLSIERVERMEDGL